MKHSIHELIDILTPLVLDDGVTGILEALAFACDRQACLTDNGVMADAWARRADAIRSAAPSI